MPERTAIAVLTGKADRLAAEVAGRFRLGADHRDDIRQELLADAIGRLRHFDPERGSLPSFVARVMTNQAARIVWRFTRERRLFSTTSLDSSLPDGQGSLGELVPESAGYLAMMGQPADRFGAVDHHLDMGRVLGVLAEAHLALCAHLVERTPSELAHDGLGSRAGIYRQVRDLRLQLTAHGLASAG